MEYRAALGSLVTGDVKVLVGALVQVMCVPCLTWISRHEGMTP